MLIELKRDPVYYVGVRSWILHEDSFDRERNNEVRIRKGNEPGVRIRMIAYKGWKPVIEEIIDGLDATREQIWYSVEGSYATWTHWEEVDSIEIYEEMVEGSSN